MPAAAKPPEVVSPGARPPASPLVSVALVVGGGIVVDRYYSLSLPTWICLAVLSWVAWLVLWRQRREALAAILLLFSIGAVGGAWHHCHWSLYPRDDVGFLATAAGQPVCLQATAVRAPRPVPPPPPDRLGLWKPSPRCRLELAVDAVRDRQTWRSVSGRSEIFVEGQLGSIRSGDRLLVFAQIKRPSPPLNPGQFDYAAFVRAGRQRSVLHGEHPATVAVLARGPWNLTRLVDSARAAGQRWLWEHIAPERFGLAAALLLGAREQLEPEHNEAYLETGTIHLLVVSGMHVALLAAAIWFVVRRFRVPRWASVLLVAAAVLFYMLVTDAQAPVVRATVLVLATCLAMALGRPTMAFNTLAAAAIVLVIANPSAVFNIGAQLSFLSVACLAFLAETKLLCATETPPLERLAQSAQSRWVRAGRGLRRVAWDLLLVSTVVWAVVAPLVMARFHLFTPVAPLANLLACFPVNLAMITGFIAGGFGWLPLIGNLLGMICDASLATLQFAIQLARFLPRGHCFVPGPGDLWLAGFYAALGIFVAFPAARSRWRIFATCLALWIAGGLAASPLSRPRGELHCTFLSLGHGGSAVVELPEGKTLLFDAGQMGPPAQGARTIADYLWSRGIAHLDAVVLSHPDSDHYNALPDLADWFSIGAVYANRTLCESRSPGLVILRDLLAKAKIPLVPVAAGDRLATRPGASLEVLHPPPGARPESTNAGSVVLAVGDRDGWILLPGDLDGTGVDRLMAETVQPCQVLVAPHHGSHRSRLGELVQWCRPTAVVISGRHPRETDEAKFAHTVGAASVWHTAIHGAVTVRFSRGHWQIGSRLDPGP